MQQAAALVQQQQQSLAASGTVLKARQGTQLSLYGSHIGKVQVQHLPMPYVLNHVSNYDPITFYKFNILANKLSRTIRIAPSSSWLQGS